MVDWCCLGTLKEDPRPACTFENATHSTHIIFIRTESYGESYSVGETHSESELKEWDYGKLGNTDWVSE